MMTENLIERHFNAGRYEALLDILTANDVPIPFALRVRLAQYPACCVGLALSRLVDITWGPTGLSKAMTAVLVQAADAPATTDDPLALAVIAAALSKVTRLHRLGNDSKIIPALDQAVMQLAQQQHPDADQPLFGGTDDRTIQDRAMISAFILYLLAKEDSFRQLTRFSEVMTWFEQHRLELDDQTQQLFVLARMRSGRRQPVRHRRKAVAA